MTIVRSTLSLAVFAAVLFGFRWGVNAVIHQAINQSQDNKNLWGDGKSPFAAKPVTGLDTGIHPFDMKGFQDGFLYRPNENGMPADRRDR
jgi:hypothetical protein